MMRALVTIVAILLVFGAIGTVALGYLDGDNNYVSLDVLGYLADLPENLLYIFKTSFIWGKVNYLYENVVKDREWNIESAFTFIPDCVECIVDYYIERVAYITKLVGIPYMYAFEVDRTPYV